jgi:hypothetical protein
MKQFFAAAMLLTLAACQQANDDNFAIDETNSANAQIETLPPDEGNDQTAEANSIVPPATLAIPAAFRGRWGMVPEDCTSTRGDAKGLLVIEPTAINFFESRGTLTKVTGDFPENFTGTFAFTGEGENWTNSQNLKLTDSSNKLIRKQSGIAQPFTYKRCA